MYVSSIMKIPFDKVNREKMIDQAAVAASEDYGRDVEHVELLIQVMIIIINKKLSDSYFAADIVCRKK